MQVKGDFKTADDIKLMVSILAIILKRNLLKGSIGKSSTTVKHHSSFSSSKLVILQYTFLGERRVTGL